MGRLPVIDKLGNPVGDVVYRPLNSTGEDFLANYLGEIGLPVELFAFSTHAKTVLLTAAVAHDPNILAEIKTHLMAELTIANLQFRLEHGELRLFNTADLA